jgi:hypothetical protein
MFSERRQHKRYVINRIAKFQVDSTALPRDCMISDISESGARLFADGVEVPDKFSLLISGERGDQRECRVMWRLGGEIGVTFVDGRARQQRTLGRRSA